MVELRGRRGIDGGTLVASVMVAALVASPAAARPFTQDQAFRACTSGGSSPFVTVELKAYEQVAVRDDMRFTLTPTAPVFGGQKPYSVNNKDIAIVKMTIRQKTITGLDRTYTTLCVLNTTGVSPRVLGMCSPSLITTGKC